jgi:hypothetical protein
MSGGDQVDVGTTPILQLEHHPGQAFDVSYASDALMIDLPINAVNAAKITMGEKNSAGTAGSHQWGLLPEMFMVGGNFQFGRGLAYTLFSIQPGGAALPGAKAAAFHHFP